MKKVFITVTGTKFYFGQEFLEKGMSITLKKEPDNEYDKEAIKAEMDGLGQIGHVANSVSTVLGESMSAGRLYDRIGETAEAEVLYVLPQGVVCVVREQSLLWEPEERNRARELSDEYAEGY